MIIATSSSSAAATKACQAAKASGIGESWSTWTIRSMRRGSAIVPLAMTIRSKRSSIRVATARPTMLPQSWPKSVMPRRSSASTRASTQRTCLVYE